MRIVALTHEDDAVVWQAALSALRPDLHARVEYLPKTSILAQAQLVALLRDHDCVVLPLTLPGFNSVRLAELAHLLRSQTRVVLHSATNLDCERVLRLFDACWPAPMEPRRILEVARVRVRRITGAVQLERAVREIVEGASCFASHDGAEGGPYAEYRRRWREEGSPAVQPRIAP